jgi:hypothetical protein
MMQVRHEVHMREMRNAYTVFVTKSEGKRPHRIPRYKCNIKVDLKIGWAGCT